MESLKRIRKMRGMNQVDLARASGVAQNTISEIENGHREARPGTLRKLAKALDVEIADFFQEPAYPKAPASPSPLEPSLFNGVLAEERRQAEQFVAQWEEYLALRVDWCGQVVEKTAEDEWNNPFRSLDSAIQWALYINIERAHLMNIVNRNVIPHADPPEAAQELQRLVESFTALSERTDNRVNAMIEAAELDEEDKERTKLRLIEGGKKSA